MAKTNNDQPLGTPIAFRDKAFKSRTIIIDDGRAFQVEKYGIEAQDPALIAYLDKHPEFERVASN